MRCTPLQVTHCPILQNLGVKGLCMHRLASNQYVPAAHYEARKALCGDIGSDGPGASTASCLRVARHPAMAAPRIGGMATPSSSGSLPGCYACFPREASTLSKMLHAHAPPCFRK